MLTHAYNSQNEKVLKLMFQFFISILTTNLGMWHENFSFTYLSSQMYCYHSEIERNSWKIQPAVTALRSCLTFDLIFLK